MSAAAAMPGMTTAAMILRRVGRRPAPSTSDASSMSTGSILVEKKKSTSVHLFTGRIDRALAAGKASRMTRIVETTLPVSELASGVHGPASKKVR